MASNSLRTELQNLRDRLQVAQAEYLRANQGQTLDALLIEAGRKDIASPDAVHRLLIKKKFVPKSTETVIYNARFGEDVGADPNANPCRRLSLIGNPIGAEWFLRLCQEGMDILGGVELDGVDPRVLSVGLCNLRRGLKWTPAERKPNGVDLTRASRARWLWLMFDLAWRTNAGTTLFAFRKFTHPKFDIELPYDPEFFGGRCRKPRPANFIADEMKWAKRLPDYFHSHIKDVFAKSLTMIDVLLRNIDDQVTPDHTSVDPAKLKLALEFIRTEGPKVGKEVATHVDVDPGTFRKLYVKPLEALGVRNNRDGKGYFAS